MQYKSLCTLKIPVEGHLIVCKLRILPVLSERESKHIPKGQLNRQKLPTTTCIKNTLNAHTHTHTTQLGTWKLSKGIKHGINLVKMKCYLLELF